MVLKDMRLCFDGSSNVEDSADAPHVNCLTDFGYDCREFVHKLDLAIHQPALDASYPTNCYLFAPPDWFRLSNKIEFITKEINENSNGTEIYFPMYGKSSQINAALYAPNMDPNRVVYFNQSQMLTQSQIDLWLFEESRLSLSENSYSIGTPRAFYKLAYQLQMHQYLDNSRWNYIGFQPIRNSTPEVMTTLRERSLSTPVVHGIKMAFITLCPANFKITTVQEQRIYSVVNSLGNIGGVIGLLASIQLFMFGYRPKSPWGIVQSWSFGKMKHSIIRRLTSDLDVLDTSVPLASIVHERFSDKLRSVHFDHTSRDDATLFETNESGEGSQRTKRLEQRVQLMELMFKVYYVDDEIFRALQHSINNGQQSVSNAEPNPSMVSTINNLGHRQNIRPAPSFETRDSKELIKNGESSSKRVSFDQQAEMRAKLESMMQNLAMMEQAELLKASGRKTMEDHKFWNTQPVPKHDEEVTEIGQIEPSVPVDQVSKEPPKLPKEFEWCELDLNDEKEVKELYELLTLNYVEDGDAQFRFDYSAHFLKWALQPPKWRKSWHVGVRVAANKKLVAFISGIPADMRTYNVTQPLTDINFLCVHKKLRSKRLAPVLIREITRRSHLENIFQAVYTAGVVLPKPVATCRYFHRSLNPKKLVECNFSRVPPKWTLARMIKHYKVPDETATAGLRIMRDEDAAEVRVLLNNYLSRFDLSLVFETDEDVKHWIVPHEDVVWSYVVENPETHKITDMFSFYSLPSSVINNPKHSTLNAAYIFYYAMDVPAEYKTSKEEEEKYIKTRLNDLIKDALVLAKKAGFDVVNALDLMDNIAFVEDQKFGPGDGHLNYYLYNWKCPDVARNKVGLVML
ncbi:glycylpeptide N-tetradecanoyltransferase [Apophysomyces sp. BC1015]|nr:glycylpeptide N-tetradecanoyltransferase [Apophysomyces sp. BC1015]